MSFYLLAMNGVSLKKLACSTQPMKRVAYEVTGFIVIHSLTMYHRRVYDNTIASYRQQYLVYNILLTCYYCPVVKLRIQQLAEERGITLATFQREAKLPPATARRIWYSTSNGSRHGPSLESADFRILEIAAAFLGVSIGELFEVSE